MNAVLIGLALLALPAAAEVSDRTVLVLRVAARGGISADVADLLTSSVGAKVKAQRRFERVVSSKEVESLLGFEQQKQLMSCEETSCMAQIATALGARYAVDSNVGRVGSSLVFNMSLIDAGAARSLGAISETFPTGDESLIASSLDYLVQKLLDDSGIPRGPDSPAPVPRPEALSAPTRAVETPVAAAVPPPSTSTDPVDAAREENKPRKHKKRRAEREPPSSPSGGTAWKASLGAAGGSCCVSLLAFCPTTGCLALSGLNAMTAWDPPALRPVFATACGVPGVLCGLVGIGAFVVSVVLGVTGGVLLVRAPAKDNVEAEE